MHMIRVFPHFLAVEPLPYALLVQWQQQQHKQTRKFFMNAKEEREKNVQQCACDRR